MCTHQRLLPYHFLSASLPSRRFIQGFPKAAQLLDDMSKNPDLTFSTASAVLEEAA